MIDKIKSYLFPSTLVILIFLVLFYIIRIFYGENSISRLDKMIQEKMILENKIVKLKEDNKIARMELDILTNNQSKLIMILFSLFNLTVILYPQFFLNLSVSIALSLFALK